MSDNYVKLCTCRACNNVFIDTDPGDDSTSYPTEVVRKFKLKELKDNDCPVCPQGSSELVSNLDKYMKRPKEIQTYVTKLKTKQYLSAV